MYDKIIKEAINDNSLSESFAYQPNQIFVHKLIKSDPIIDERIMMLVHRGVIKDPKNVYIYSFVHPDWEYAVSVTAGILVNGPSSSKVWLSYMDPGKLILNKRMGGSGFSLEGLSSSNMKTLYFLATGRPALFKKIAEVPCHTISTTVPVPLPGGAFVWENFKSNLTIPNTLKCSYLQIKRGKVLFVPQIFTKSNYVYEYTMVTK